LIDPYNGVADLNARVLRHVGDAFIEDPVRVLRGARFGARLASLGFQIAPETMALMQRIARSGELDHLVPERVWQELARGMMEATPSRMFAILRDCGALQHVLPEVDRLFGVPQSAKSHPEIDTGVHVMMVLDYAAQRKHSLPIRFAALCHDLGKGITPKESWPRHPDHEKNSVRLTDEVCDRLRVPNDCRDLARMTARWHGDVHAAMQRNAQTLLTIMDATDALRRPDRFRDFVEACACDHHGRLGYADTPYPPREFLLDALAKLQTLNFAAIAQTNANDIPAAIDGAKIEQLQRFIKERNTA
jgi:tRNA nucleotidyltransferase (CCA-adding enzyme)